VEAWFDFKGPWRKKREQPGHVGLYHFNSTISKVRVVMLMALGVRTNVSLGTCAPETQPGAEICLSPECDP